MSYSAVIGTTRRLLLVYLTGLLLGTVVFIGPITLEALTQTLSHRGGFMVLLRPLLPLLFHALLELLEESSALAFLPARLHETLDLLHPLQMAQVGLLLIRIEGRLHVDRVVLVLTHESHLLLLGYLDHSAAALFFETASELSLVPFTDYL